MHIILVEKWVDKSMPPLTEKITYAHLVPFSNGRREGVNPSSRVIVLPGLEFPNFRRLVMSFLIRDFGP